MSADAPDRFLRRAGTGALPDGWLVTWTVAEGTRGRRWRWTVVSPAGMRHAGLVELDPDGRFGRLELETAHGMLTLHPDLDRRAAHGNVARPGGVDPVEIAWSDDDGLAMEDDPFGSAVARWQGRGWVVAPDLQLRREDGGDTRALDLDERGIPRLDEAREWPLEI
jgi:hypothetical protein